MDTKTKTAVIVAVIIVVLVGVYAAQALDDKHEDYRDSTETYYFYLDGMDSHNGWYTADGENAQDAMEKIGGDAKLDITFNDKGWLSIDGYEGSTADSIGLGILVYTSTDMSNPYAGYFTTGPVVKDVIGNILYVTYSTYSFDANYNTTYSINPSTSTAWKTGGPFAQDSDYKAPSYDTYYFYLGGTGTADGWYSASGDNIKDAFVTATKDSGLSISFGTWGNILIESCPAEYDSTTGAGKGIGISDYLSKDPASSVWNVANSNFCPTLEKTASNIVIIMYGDYTTDLSTYQMTYTNNPTTNTAWLVGGPFAA